MSEINYLNLSFKKLEKVQQSKPKVSRKKEIIEWKSMKQKTTKNLNEMKSWYFEIINKIDKLEDKQNR